MVQECRRLSSEQNPVHYKFYRCSNVIQ